jgi:hypothetical protein
LGDSRKEVDDVEPGGIHLFARIVSQNGRNGKGVTLEVNSGWVRAKEPVELRSKDSRGRLSLHQLAAADGFGLGVESGDAGEGGGGFGELGEIFVAFETNRDSDFGFGKSGSRGIVRGLSDAQDVSAAADTHVFSESDFGGHAEGDFDFCAFLKRDIGEEEDAARAEILGEAKTLDGGCDLTKRQREKVREPLSDAAFHSNWRSSHR